MIYEKAESYSALKTFFGSETGAGMVHYLEQQEGRDEHNQETETLLYAVIMCMVPSNKEFIKHFSILKDGEDYQDFDTNYIQTNITEECTNSTDAEGALVAKV